MAMYKYYNQEDYSFQVPELCGVRFDATYFSCIHGYMTIKKGYAWDGCTLAPDSEKTRLASMVHDALYQYGKQLKLKRKVADLWFQYLLNRESFRWANFYYKGVRFFGWIFY